jgi:hypothetical protein
MKITKGRALAFGGLGALALGAAGLALAQEDHAGPGRHGGERMAAMHGGGPHGGMGHGRMRRLLDLRDRFDRDGDGTVSQAEIDVTRTERLAAFDRDGDGVLSLEEFEAHWLDARRRAMVRRFQANDVDGDGRVTAEEFRARTGRLVTLRDRDGDDALGLGDLRGRR